MAKKSDPNLFHGRKILSPASKSIVRQVVNRLHCGASKLTVQKTVLKSLKNRKSAPAWIKKLLIKEAVKVHKANGALYCRVMSGSGPLKRPR